MNAHDFRTSSSYRPAPAGESGAIADILDPSSLFQFFKRRAPIIASLLALALAAATALFFTTDRQYRATAELLFEVTGANVASSDTGYVRSTIGDRAIDTQVEVLRSPSLVRAAIVSRPELRQALGVDDAAAAAVAAQVNAEVTAPAFEGAVSASGVETRVRRSADTDLPVVAGSGPLAGIERAVEREEDVLAARRIARRLTVERKGDTSVVDLAYLDASPEKAAVVLNALIETYLDLQRRTKTQASAEANELLRTRIDELRTEVAEAEEAVEAFRSARGLVSTGEASLEERRVASLQELLAKSRAERRLLELKVERLRTDGVSSQLSSATLLDLMKRRNDADRELAKLRQRYGAEHPLIVTARQEVSSMDSQIAAEKGQIAQTLRDEFIVAQQVEQTLETELEEMQGILRDREAFQVELRELERQASASREVYENFLTTAKRRAEEESAISADATVLEPARAGAVPFAPKLSYYLLVAGLVGLMTGVGVGLVLDYNPNSIESVQQLEKTINVRGLGYVPEVRPFKGATHISDAIISRPRSIYADSVNRMAVMLDMIAADTGREAYVGQSRATPVLFTSAISQEGKSSTALAFARSCASVGERVILIDADMRRPAIGKYLGLDVRVGVEDVLRQEAALSDAVVKDALSDLVILPATGWYGRPTELVKSSAFQELLKRLEAEYDRIIIDAPPVLAFPEAVILGNHCAVTVLAVKWRSTKTTLVRDALGQLSSGGARVAGVVLTLAHLSSMQTAGFYDAKYYTNEDDFASPASSSNASSGARRRPARRAPESGRPPTRTSAAG